MYLPVHTHAFHTETSISYDFETLNEKRQVADVDACTDDFQIVLSPERNALYGDIGWRFLILNAIEKAQIASLWIAYRRRICCLQCKIHTTGRKNTGVHVGCVFLGSLLEFLWIDCVGGNLPNSR
ncbi:hypothetical protein ABFS82_01G094700 [Erythranthe guttata]